jgi:ABC-2 type transport system permease protein
MNTFVTLLKREWAEAKVPFFWLPLGTLAFIVIVGLLGLLVSGFADFQIEITSNQTSLQSAPSFLFLDQWSDSEFEDRMTAFRLITALPFFLIYAISAIFVLLGALYDDRKDRSVLFWKSMPVSDLETVLSKLVLVVWVAPLLAIAFSFLAQIFLLVVATFYIWGQDLGDASRIWWHSGMLIGTFQMVLGFFIQSLWSLPLTGFLLLVSALVPRLTLLWAILVPTMISATEFIIFRTSVISSWLARHWEVAALPTLGDGDGRIMPMVRTVGDQLDLLINPDLWLGVLIGAAILYGASRIRGLKNEL